jgi:hypothetical protein
MLVFMIPFPAQADGGSDGLTQTVNGYHVSLAFAEEPAVGENQIHVQLHDAMDMPVSDATVAVTLTPVEKGHGETEESPAHDSMPESHTAEPASDHGANAHVEIEGFVLKPSHHEEGEYAGEIHVESTGDWTVTVHVTVQEEEMAAEFPLMIKSSSRNVILAGFAGINILILVVAATLRRKPVIK